MRFRSEASGERLTIPWLWLSLGGQVIDGKLHIYAVLQPGLGLCLQKPVLLAAGRLGRAIDLSNLG
jgi:hypothetical protein